MAIPLTVLGVVLIGLTLPAVAAAQPLGWSAGSHRLEVVNLATGTLQAAYDAPEGEWFALGALTPDGRFYLLPTSQGVLRFRTGSLSIDGPIGPPVAVDQLAVSPIGSRVHTIGPSGHRVIDWESGQLIRESCCDGVSAVHFTPDGRIRLELSGGFGAYVLTAIASATETILWTRGLDYHWVELAVSNTSVAVNTDYSDMRSVLILRVGDGTLQRSLGLAPNGMAWRGEQLLVSQIVYDNPPVPGRHRLHLSALDQSMRSRVIAERVPAHPNSLTGPVAVSPDSRHVVWLYYDWPSTAGARYVYDAFDLETNHRVSGGMLGESVLGLAIQDPDACALQVPSEVQAPIEGGVISFPVVPAAPCRPWSVPDLRVLNPGPHSGPATLFVRMWPNADASSRTSVVGVGTRSVLITQPSGVPAAPVLEAAVVGNRVALSWTPATGAGITSFVVRGAIAGSAVSDVFQLPAHVRAWSSPPLPPGSYEVELVAVNGAGRSPASNRRSVSVGVTDLPQPPTGLSALVADDRVELTWTPAPTGPAPAGFVIEAAASGSVAFVSVARSDVPSFIATRVPIGAWQVRVRAATAGGVGEPSAAVSVTTAPCTAPPGAPQAPWAIWTAPSVSVRWSPPSVGSVEDYVIEVGSVSGADLGHLVVPGTRVSHTEPVSSLAAFVRVRARNACGVSAPSADIPIVVY